MEEERTVFPPSDFLGLMQYPRWGFSILLLQMGRSWYSAARFSSSIYCSCTVPADILVSKRSLQVGYIRCLSTGQR